MPCMYVQPPAAGFLPVGMVKDGTTFPLDTTYKQITGWTADPAYPGSSVVSNGLVAQSAAASATITASIPWTASFSTTTTLRLFQNGVQIAQGTGISGSSGTSTAQATGVAVAAGDVITVQATTSNSFGATVSASTGTVRVVSP